MKRILAALALVVALTLPLAAQLNVVYSRSGASTTPDPTFSPVSPYSGSATSVTITDAAPSAGPAATINYCTDAVNTCTPSTPYTGPISVTSTEYIRAQAQYLGVPASNVVSWSGTIATGGATYKAGYTNNAASHAVTGTIAVAAGDLIWLQSKTGFDGGAGQTLTVSTTSGPSCTWTPVFSSPITLGTTFTTAAFYCIAPSSGTLNMTATWSGTSTFSDIALADYSPATTFTGLDVYSAWDQSNSIVSGCVSSPGSPPSTTNANDLIIFTGQTFNQAEGFGTIGGFTARASSTRNTSGFYDEYVTSSGTALSFNMPLANADVCVGAAAAFKD